MSARSAAPLRPFLSGWLALLVAVAVYLLLVLPAHQPGLRSPDESTYLGTARQLAERGTFSWPQETMRESLPPGFLVVSPRGGLYPKYPPGFPVLLAAFRGVLGERGDFLASIVLGGVGLLALFLLMRRLSASPLAQAVGILLLAVTPLYIYYSLSAMADVASVVAAVGTVALAFPGPAARSGRRLFLSGILWGAGLTLRLTNALLALPLAVALLVVGPGEPRGLAALARRGLWIALGLSPPLAGLLWYQARAFGSPWVAGYGLTGEEVGLFMTEGLAGRLKILLGAFFLTGMPVTAVLGAAGALVGVLRQRPGRLLLWAWILPIVLFHAGYFWVGYGRLGHCRYLLAAVPPLLLGVGGLAERLAGAGRGGRRVAMAALILGLCGIPSAWVARREALELRSEMARGLQAVQVVTGALPPGSHLYVDHRPRAVRESLSYFGAGGARMTYLFTVVPGWYAEVAARHRERSPVAVDSALLRLLVGGEGAGAGAALGRNRRELEAEVAAGAPVYALVEERSLPDLARSLDPAIGLVPSGVGLPAPMILLRLLPKPSPPG